MRNHERSTLSLIGKAKGYWGVQKACIMLNRITLLGNPKHEMLLKLLENIEAIEY